MQDRRERRIAGRWLAFLVLAAIVIAIVVIATLTGGGDGGTGGY